ncbi:MAG: AAA family ATPase [Micrococcales bacterium]|nr:AAA family ATPase [Micrococcales bacterium]
MTLVEQALDLAASRSPRCGHTRIVAVDGPSGSGKTMLAARLQEGLAARGHQAQVVHMDDLFPGWDGLAAAASRLSEWVLTPLAQGSNAAYRRYDWVRAQYAEWHPVPAADWLVVEGVGCGSRVAAARYAVLLWVEAEREERMRRGLERDGETFAPHWRRWADQEAVVFAHEGTRSRADMISDTTTAPGGAPCPQGTGRDGLPHPGTGSAHSA